MEKPSKARTSRSSFNQASAAVAGFAYFVKKSATRICRPQRLRAPKKRIGGNPFDKNTEQGPQRSGTVHKVHGLHRTARKKKPNSRWWQSRWRKGYFIEPTVFADVQDNNEIAQDESCGPVMSIHQFKDLGEVVERANKICRPRLRRLDPDITKAHAIADSVPPGAVWVIATTVRRSGSLRRFKQSGIGREHRRILSG